LVVELPTVTSGREHRHGRIKSYDAVKLAGTIGCSAGGESWRIVLTTSLCAEDHLKRVACGVESSEARCQTPREGFSCRRE
jgi:hypothetical protein